MFEKGVREDIKQKDKLGKQGKYKNKIITIVIIAGLVAALAYVSNRWDNSSPSAAATIDGIQCNTNEFAVLHIHTHLDVFVNGQPFEVPGGIGIVDNTCLYWMHTHKTNGVIHMESPKSTPFTLGQFFDIWKSTAKRLPQTGEQPTIFVNGAKVDVDLKDVKLNAHDEVVLVYGTKPSAIPPFYQFDPSE